MYLPSVEFCWSLMASLFFNCGYTSTSLQLTSACLTSDSDTGGGQIKARYFSPTGKFGLLSKLSVYK